MWFFCEAKPFDLVIVNSFVRVKSIVIVTKTRIHTEKNYYVISFDIFETKVFHNLYSCKYLYIKNRNKVELSSAPNAVWSDGIFGNFLTKISEVSNEISIKNK